VTRVKICGITRAGDAIAAVEAGADAIGFVLDDGVRKIPAREVRDIVRELPPFVRTVGVFRRATLRAARSIARTAGVEVIQLHGDDPVAVLSRIGRSVIQRIHVDAKDTTEGLRARIARCPGATVLIDPGAGSGIPFRWTVARGLDRRVIVAGGLHAGNVGRAIREARPYAVDVSSGVESAPGIKSVERMRAFLEAVRREDAGVPA
jgi:phosphoribosylanthranilate isomerase